MVGATWCNMLFVRGFTTYAHCMRRHDSVGRYCFARAYTTWFGMSSQTGYAKESGATRKRDTSTPGPARSTPTPNRAVSGFDMGRDFERPSTGL